MKQRTNLIYGIRAVIETARSGKHLEKIFLQKNVSGELIRDLLQVANQLEIPISRVPQEKVNRLTNKNHQGVVAFVSPVQYHNIHHVLSEIFEKGIDPFFLVLDRVTDVRNFGAIARSAECLGVHAIIISVKHGAQINPDAIKTSAGALNYIPVCREVSLVKTVNYLKQSGLKVIAGTDRGTRNIADADLTGPCVVVIGSEEEGISDQLLAVADERVRIPMKGEISSLNVSAASAIMLYEVVKQRDQM